MTKSLLEIAAEIVQAQATVESMSADDIASALVKTFTTLQQMQECEEKGVMYQSAGAVTTPEIQEPEAITPQNSIQNDIIICLECGVEFRQLTAKHLIGHQLTPPDYRNKYGIPLKTPLSAKSLTRARTRAAKKRGLPENLIKYQEEKRQTKAASMRYETPSQKMFPLPEEPKKRGRKKKVDQG